MTCLTSFQITIEIEDINDNTPKIYENFTVPVKIPEGNPERMELLQFAAQDNDTSREYSYVY
jgi:hypothetical protein